jgi:hypothetical protein
MNRGFAGSSPSIFEVASQSEYPDFNKPVLEKMGYDDSALQKLLDIRRVLHLRGLIDVCHFSACVTP